MAADEPAKIGSAPTQIGSYRLAEPLGSGGMSSVFRAIHAESGHEVALKVLPRSLAKNPTMLQRFMNEAKSAESLQHPNIVSIYDRGTEDGRHYLVLEYVPGGDLQERVKEHGPLGIAEAVGVIKEVARGLQYAVSRGLIHRDIKPANLLMGPDGRVKITDLGLALQLEEEDERVTRDGTTVGTVDYMAPEQARDSRATSVRSDIYSLGCTFYYMITGSPPFAGGDVSEKLRRHSWEAPPDPRSLRGDVPQALAALIMRMMAKRPDQRPADYASLLNSLEAIDLSEVSGDLVPLDAPLDALVDDEDGAEGPLDALIDDDDESVAPLDALIDDEDESGDIALAGGSPPAPGSTQESPIVPTLPGPGKQGGTRNKSRDEVTSHDLNLGDLAAIEEHGETLATESELAVNDFAEAARRVPAGVPLLPVPAPEVYPVERPVPRVQYGERPPDVRAADAAELRALIVKGVLSVVAIVVVGFGILQFLWHRPATSAPPEDTPESTAGESEGAIVGPVSDVGQRPRAQKTAGSSTARDVVAREVWVEPGETSERNPLETPIPPDLIEKLGLQAAAQNEASRPESPLVTVRRADEVHDADHLERIRRAFDRGGGTVELADNGPFFENDLHLTGKSRLVRARAGRRPIVVVERPTVESARSRPAVVVLDGQRLVLEGIDIVVKANDLPRNQTALFLCRGAELTLRDCTVTVVGPAGPRFAIIEVVGSSANAIPAPSRIRLERTLVRGQAAAGFHLSGSADVVVSRSAILGAGPSFVVSGEPKGERQIHLFRSVLAARSPIWQLAGTATAADALPISIRSLGCVFARLGVAPASATLIARVDEPRNSRAGASAVDWRGDFNSFVGWSDWMVSGPGRATRITGLAEARSAWSGTDAQSREFAAALGDSIAEPWSDVSAIAVKGLELAATLAIFAKPAPYLREKTIGSFDRLETAGTAKPGAAAGLPAQARSALEPVDQELSFKAQGQGNEGGDLAVFLREAARKDARRIRVRVSGAGTKYLTPMQMPEGVSLEILVQTTANGPPFTWAPAPGLAECEALIGVRDADLRIVGARFTRDATDRPKNLLRVEHGHLTLTNCWLIAPGVVNTGGGGLISFQTDGTRPLARRVGSTTPVTDRPTCTLTDCLLISGGDAVAAEVGRGIVSLTNCAVASGGAAVVLTPMKVRRDRFEADLWLDRCTIASEQDFVQLGPWTGAEPGPWRPWLVSTRACAFIDRYTRGQNPDLGVLLRAQIESLSQGTLQWQSTGDSYDLGHFVAVGEAPPALVSKADIHQQWVEFWGSSHILQPSGPSLNGPGVDVRLLGDRLRPGDVQPHDLELGPSNPRVRRPLDLGADLRRLGISVPRSERRR